MKALHRSLLVAIAGLMLALVRLPDFSTPLNRIADSLEAERGGGSPASPPAAAPEEAGHAAARHAMEASEEH